MNQRGQTFKRTDSHIHWTRRLKSWWNKNDWCVIGGLGGLAFVLAIVGYFQTGSYSASMWVEVFYKTIQLFTLNGEFPNSSPPALEIAFLLAPFITVSAAFKVAMILIHQRLQMLRLGRLKNHAVICGLGEKGKRLALDLTGQGEKVVIIESNPGNSDIDICKERGAFVIIGDATSQEVLVKARVTSAKLLFAVCVDDWTNIEIALSASKLDKMKGCEKSRKGKVKSRCFVHIVDPNLRDKIIEQGDAFKTESRFEFRPFNMFKNAAQQLFREYPPDETASKRGHETVHLLLIGFGQMGKAVALHAARIGHYKNGRKIRISVVDKSFQKTKGGFLHKYPSIEKICDIAFWEHDIDDLPFLTSDFLKDIGGVESVTQTIVCLEQEPEALRCLISLMPSFSGTQCPLLIRLNVESAFFSMLQNNANKGQTPIYPYGLVEHCSSTEMVIDEKLYQKAQMVHDAYCKLKAEQPAEENVGDESLSDWEDLTEDLKESNRQQTEHMDVKLRAINCRRGKLSEPGEQVSKFDEGTEVELLAEMEHRRWNAERSLAGWRYAPEKSIEKKLSPYLKEWEELTEKIKDYDRDVARNIPGILGEIGEKVVRGGQ